MNNNDTSLAKELNMPLTYLLETYNDRERLYRQFELTKDEFNVGFDQALQLGQLDLNSSTAIWRVLDVGCGEGLFSEEIVSRYPHAQIVGFDKDQEAVATANLAFSSRGDLHFFVHDVLMPIPNSLFSSNQEGASKEGEFDVAFAWLVLIHTRDVNRALTNIFQVLKPGGVIYLHDVPTKWLDFPHPSIKALVTVIDKALQQISTFDFGERYSYYLEQAGFIQITTTRREYILGGQTKLGQQWLKHTIDSLAGVRRAIVDALKLMDAAEFDGHIERLKREITLDVIGHSYSTTAKALKPLEG